MLIQFKSGLRLKFYYNGVMKPLSDLDRLIFEDSEVPDYTVTESSFMYKDKQHFIFSSQGEFEDKQISIEHELN